MRKPSYGKKCSGDIKFAPTLNVRASTSRERCINAAVTQAARYCRVFAVWQCDDGVFEIGQWDENHPGHLIGKATPSLTLPSYAKWKDAQ